MALKRYRDTFFKVVHQKYLKRGGKFVILIDCNGRRLAMIVI